MRAGEVGDCGGKLLRKWERGMIGLRDHLDRENTRLRVSWQGALEAQVRQARRTDFLIHRGPPIRDLSENTCQVTVDLAGEWERLQSSQATACIV